MGNKFTTCKDCFYEKFTDYETPCTNCSWSNRFIAKGVFSDPPIKTVPITKQSQDNVNHPKHYTQGGIEVIDAIEAWGLNFRLANVIKYVARADHKKNKLEDLRKALWYLNREIGKLEQPTDV